MKKKNCFEKPSTREARLLAYSAAVGAALAVTPSVAQGGIVYHEGPWTGTGRDNYLISFNLAGDVLTNNNFVTNEQFLLSQTWWEGPLGKDHWDYARLVARNGAAVAAGHFDGTWHQRKVGDERISHNYALPFVAGAAIGPGLNWNDQGWLLGTYQAFNIDDYWQNGKRAYVGLRFDGPGDEVYYGWADITTVNKQTVTMWGYAYEDSGGPILTGAMPPPPVIPVPSTLLLLASGAAGLAALRERRRGKREGEDV